MHFALPTAAAELSKIKQGSNNEDMSTSLLLSLVEPNQKVRLGVQLRGEDYWLMLIAQGQMGLKCHILVAANKCKGKLRARHTFVVSSFHCWGELHQG